MFILRVIIFVGFFSQKLSNLLYSLFGSKATEEEIQEWFAKCEAEDKERERQQQESEHDLQEYLARCKTEDEEVERDNLRLELGWKEFEDREIK